MEPMRLSDGFLRIVRPAAEAFASAASALKVETGSGSREEHALGGPSRTQDLRGSDRSDELEIQASDLLEGEDRAFLEDSPAARARRDAASAADSIFSGRGLFDPPGLEAIHRACFLPGEIPDGRRGRFRTEDVEVGRHVPPPWRSVPDLLARWSEAYGGGMAGPLDAAGLLCAHHRLLWIHPFADGNGRIARLHLRAGLIRLGFGRGWSPSNAFLRDRAGWASALSEADEPRRGSLDGRGALTEAGLAGFCSWALSAFESEIRRTAAKPGSGAGAGAGAGLEPPDGTRPCPSFGNKTEGGRA